MSIGTYLAWSLLVFASATAYDFIYAQYLRNYTLRKSIRAGNWSMTTYWVGIFGLSSVLDYSKWFIIPESIGLWLGTYLATELARIKDDLD